MFRKPNRRISQKTLGIALMLMLSLTGFLTMAASDKVSAQQEGNNQMTKDIQTIQNLVAAFNKKDIDAIMQFFTDDAVYHNMPMGPVKGTAAVRGLITGFIGPAEKLDWEILNIAQSGDTVLAERIDRFVINGKEVVLPCLGAFDMRDGKIAEWRDYFDMATWQKQNAK